MGGGDAFIKNPDLALIPHYDVKAAVNYWNHHGLLKKSDVLAEHIFVPLKREVMDNFFQSAVKSINVKMLNINRRAIAYNQYINIFK